MNRQQRRQNQRAIKKGLRPPNLKHHDKVSELGIDDNKQYQVGGVGDLIVRGNVFRALVQAGYVSLSGTMLKDPMEVIGFIGVNFPELKIQIVEDDAFIQSEQEKEIIENVAIVDTVYYDIDGLTVPGFQLRELIRAGYVSGSGIALKSVSEILYYLGKAFPNVFLKTLPNEQNQEDTTPDNYFKDQTFPIINNENNINDNDEEQDSILKARVVIQTGVEAKRRGDYTTALARYEEAMVIAPGYLPCHYALGKLNYLLGHKEASLLNYTVAAHLQASLGAAQDLNDELKEIKDERIRLFPDNLKKQFRTVHNQAIILLIDENTPKHIGHTLVDLPTSNDMPQEVRKARKSYRDSIAGKAFQQLDHELEGGMYHSTGASYLLQRIHWNKVGKHPVEDVYRLYSEENPPSVSEAISETQLQWVFGELESSIGLRKVHATTPFRHLVDEIRLAWKAEHTDSNIELQNLAQLAFQAAEKLIINPYDMTTGPLVLDALTKGNTSQVTMIKRWDGSIKLVQTPLVDFLFALSHTARNHRHQTPVLNTVIHILKNKDLIDLRNGLVHGTYWWEDSKNGVMFLNILDGTTVISHLNINQCEAFHALICICALALEQVSTSPEFNAA